jgi:hypothetical protein
MDTLDVVDFKDYNSKTIISFAKINTVICKETLTQSVKVANFFDNDGKRIYVETLKEPHKNALMENKNSLILSASCPKIKTRGEKVKPMNNMCCFIYVFNKNSFHIKVSDKGIVCVGNCPFEEIKKTIFSFIKIIEKQEEDIKKIKNLSKDQFIFIMNIFKTNCVKNDILLREDEFNYFSKKEVSPLSVKEDNLIKKNDTVSDGINVFLKYLDDYDNIDDFIEKCEFLYNEKHEIYKPNIPIEILEFQIFNSIYYFKTKLDTFLIRRINLYEYILKTRKDDKIEMNMMFHPWNKHMIFISVFNKETNNNQIFNIYDTGTIKQISASLPEEAYYLYTELIKTLNSFIEEENKTFYKDIKKINIIKKDKKKKNKLL